MEVVKNPTEEVVQVPAVATQKDFFRDTWFRYVGYSNEVGEAFGPRFPKFVRPSYAMAYGYVLADTMSKTMDAMMRRESNVEVVRIFTDTLLWQTLASVLIPGKVINIVTAQAVKVFQSDAKIIKSLPLPARTWGPTAVGLATIPFIVHPIDSAVDALFDATLRQWWPNARPADSPSGKAK
jgi:fission process protein 1